MEDGSSLPLWGIIILFMLFLLNGIFYGFAAAVQNLSEGELQRRALEGDKKAIKLLEFMNHPSQYVNAIPLMVISSGICFGTFFVPWAVREFHPYIKHIPAMLLVLIPGVILLAALGILTFRRIGSFSPERFAYRWLGVVSFFSNILYPVTMCVTWIAKLAARPFGITLDQTMEAVTEEEIISMVDEAHEQGVIEENEAEMIQNIISFNETEAKDIMTHRKNVVAFDEEMLLQEMIDEMLEEGNSRYPVFREDLDNIVGIVHYKDALKFMTKNPWAKFKPLKELPGLIRTAAFIPETRGIGDLFHTMQAKKLHMAIVVDEYGQTAGLVSMEDILEEIVGEILDEYDEDEVTIRTQVDNSVMIDGLVNLEDVEEELGVDFGDCEFETLNGYLTSLLGHIPTKKDLDKEIVANGYRFQILSLGNKTIGRVRAEKIKQETKGEDKCQDIQNSQT
ncbi:MAG: HlyC/CorC family transporter [Clostridiales bacterium]|nr:HlyC/CorC family transporter [Clostridiales bacterium]